MKSYEESCKNKRRFYREDIGIKRRLKWFGDVTRMNNTMHQESCTVM